jgi:TolA-binding protein
MCWAVGAAMAAWLAGAALAQEAGIVRPAVTAPAAPDPLAESLVAARAASEDGLHGIAEKQATRYLRLAASAGNVRGSDVQEAFHLLARALHEQAKDGEVLERSQPGDAATKALFLAMPDQGVVPFWRAYAQFHLGRHDLALKELDGFESRFAGSGVAGKARRLRASALVRVDRLADALTEYAAFDKQFGSATAEGAENLVDWAKGLAATNRLAEAESLFARVVEQAETPPDVRLAASYGLGETRLRQGKFDGAEQALQTVIADPRTAGDRRAQAWFLVADARAARTNAVEEVAALRKALDAAQDAALRQHGAYRLGSRLIKTGGIEEGIPLLKSFIAAQPQNPLSASAQLWMANELLTNGNPDAALAEFQTYLESYSSVEGQAQACEGKGWSLLALHRHAEAATAFMKAFGLHSDPARRVACLLKAGDAQFENGQLKAATECYRRILTEFPDSEGVPDALYQLGQALTRMKDGGGALAAWGRLSDGFPSHPLAEGALLQASDLRSSMGQYGLAIEGYNRLMRTYTNGAAYPAALYGRGEAHYKQVDFRQALADFEEMVARFAPHPMAEQAFVKKGLCHYWLGEDDRAVALHREFTSRYTNSPLMPGVQFWLAKYEFNRGDFAAAESAFLSVASSYPTNALSDSALLWAGLSASKRKEYGHAVEILTRMTKEYPDSPKIPEARFAQADALFEQHQYALAILIYDEIVARQPKGELAARAMGRKGDCQFMLGSEDRSRYAESIQSYKAVAAHEAAMPELVLQAEYKIGRSLEQLERIEEAREQYYVRVVVRYFQEREKGVWPTEDAKKWLTRAALRTADILESANEWRQAVKVLGRIVEAGVPEAEAATERIQKIRKERWWLF